MREQVLIDYLQYKIAVEDLAADLQGTQKRTSHDTTAVYIVELDSEIEFKVKREHLLRLCNEALDGKLSFEDLNTIAYALFTSEHLNREENDQIMEDVLFAWDNPEIGFPLTIENMKKWKLLMEKEIDTFDVKEIKQKRKNND